MVSDGLEFYPLYPNAFFSLYNFIVLCRVAKWLLESHVPKLGEDTNYDLNTATACHPNHPIIPFMALCIPFLALSDSCHAHISVSASSCCHAMKNEKENLREKVVDNAWFDISPNSWWSLKKIVDKRFVSSQS